MTFVLVGAGPTGVELAELLTRFLGMPPNAKTQALFHSVREAAYVPVGSVL
jgi:NADH dehydrogenase FAD-containing subunit